MSCAEDAEVIVRVSVLAEADPARLSLAAGVDVLHFLKWGGGDECAKRKKVEEKEFAHCIGLSSR